MSAMEQLQTLVTDLNDAASRATVAAQALNDATRRFDAARTELGAMLRDLRGENEPALPVKPN